MGTNRRIIIWPLIHLDKSNNQQFVTAILKESSVKPVIGAADPYKIAVSSHLHDPHAQLRVNCNIKPKHKVTSCA